jgi:hypothetical protein
MTKFIIVALLIVTPVFAQTQPPAPVAPAAHREQIRADRAKAAEDEKNGSTARPWARDADGKRPWEKPAKRLDE